MKKPICNIKIPHAGYNCACNEEEWEKEWDSQWTRPKSGECDKGCCKLWEGKRDLMSEGQKDFIRSEKEKSYQKGYERAYNEMRHSHPEYSMGFNEGHSSAIEFLKKMK